MTAAVDHMIQRLVFHKLEGTDSVVCGLVLHNGHVVIGEAHCAPGTVFDGLLGMKYSREDAERKLGELAAFSARERTNPTNS
jgi:hypothetical protein